MASPYQRPGSSLKQEQNSEDTTNPAEIDMGCTWNCCSCIHTKNRCPKQSKLLDNRLNVLDSRVPYQFKFHKEGQWIDFPQSSRKTLIDGFKKCHSYLEIETGDLRLGIDFMSMCMLNLATKEYCSIAWIDEYDKGCFPKSFIDDGDAEFFEDNSTSEQNNNI